MTLSSNRIYKVANVINNNIVTVTDFNGREMIAIGKGTERYIDDYKLTRYACSLEE